MSMRAWIIVGLLIVAAPSISAHLLARQNPARQNSTPAASAEALLADALAKAKAEQKAVFVHFGASWCGPCLKLDEFLHAPQTAAAIAANFVILNLTVFERGAKDGLNNQGAAAMMERWGGGSSIPFYVFLDAAGTRLGFGTGYPGGMAEVRDFMALVDRSAPRLAAADRSTLTRYLESHSDGLGSIAGAVVNEEGKPVARASVTALVPVFVDGRWTYAESRRAETDASGRYVIDQVAAGNYKVVVETAWNSAGRNTAPVTMFFPAARSLGEAATIPLQRGQGLTTINVSVAGAVHGRVSGVVTAANGTPAANVPVMLVDTEWPSKTFATSTSADGSFLIERVPPASYVIAARPRPSEASAGPAPAAFSRLEVRDAQPVSLQLQLGSGATVAGTLRVNGGVLTAADRQAMRVSAHLATDAPAAFRPVGVSRLSSSLDREGRFEIAGLHAPATLRVDNLPQGWILESVIIGTTDVTDTPIDLPTAGGGDPISIVVSNGAAELAGTVMDNEKPARSGVVIVFADDPAQWRHPSRFLRTTPVQADGTFSVGNLPPANYLVASTPSLAKYWDAPESLEALRAGARPIELAPGQRARLVVAVKPLR